MTNFIPTNAEDFKNPKPEHSKMVWSLEHDITIDGNVDMTGCKGVIFKDGGGTIDFGTHDVLFDDVACFDFPYNRKVMDFSKATINDKSTFICGDINLVNFGLVGDGNIEKGTGTDNRNVFLQAQKIYNSSGGNARIDGKGVFMYSLVETTRSPKNIPSNWYVTGTATMTLATDVIVGALPNDLEKYDIINFWNTKNSFLKGGEIVGELRHHDFSKSVSEHNHAIYISSGNVNLTIDTSAREVAGDCIYFKYAPNFIHLNKVTAEKLTKGKFIDDDGVIKTDDRFSYSQKFDVSHEAFDKINGFVFGGGSYSGRFGLDVHEYWAVFYDGSGNFIGRSLVNETYNRVNKPKNCKYIALVIYTPKNWNDLKGTIYAPDYSIGTVIKSKSLIKGLRQGLSNPAPHTTISGCTISEIGRGFRGEKGKPGYGWDVEDGAQNNFNIDLIYVVFHDNLNGDIVLKGCRYITIRKCKFLQSKIQGYTQKNIISINGGYNVVFENNLVQNRTLMMGRANVVTNNELSDVTLHFELENEVFKNHSNAKNVKIETGHKFHKDGVAYIEKSSFIYDRPLDKRSVFYHRYGLNLIYRDVVFDFMGQEFNTTNQKLSQVATANPMLSKGSVDKLQILNVHTKSSLKHKIGLDWPVQDIKRMVCDTSLLIRVGLPRDFKISNGTTNGCLRLMLDNYPDSNQGEFTTATIKDQTINIDDLDLLLRGTHAVQVFKKDVNIVFDNCIVKINTDNPTGNILDLQHNGGTLIKNTNFISKVPGSKMDLNKLKVKPIHLENNKFYNIDFTPRDVDVVLQNTPTLITL
ncbi:hypothetical protein [Aquimarina intermedia]|uniref:Parallel beta helix pectate lyase-like protein n=1 Tax=Aquimarina intermedia TaxID=350814 RepID=A0A5S5BYQ1_9FLAO|nr:hypothetical protein [Aquimarina intermedia]TYP71478.1 hypothetical protein BD809_10960 [Aquimarina intermedia]